MLLKSQRIQSINIIAGFTSPFDWILKDLSRIPSPTLRLINFEVICTETEVESLSNEVNHMIQLEEFFDDPNPPKFAESVAIQFICYPSRYPKGNLEDYPQLRQAIENALPSLHSQGRVTVKICRENLLYWL